MSDSRVNHSSEDARRAYLAETNRNSRPTNPPKSNKDFNKVLNKSQRHSDDKNPTDNVGEETDEGEGDGFLLSSDQSVAEGKRPPSLFDLSGAKKMFTPPPFGDSSTTLYGKARKPDTTPNLKEDGDVNLSLNDDSVKSGDDEDSSLIGSTSEGKKTLDPNADALGAISKKGERGEKEGNTDDMGSSDSSSEDKNGNKLTRANNDQQNIAYGASLAHAPQGASSVEFKQDNVKSTVNLQELIKQMVDSVQEMKAGGQTDTEITLKQPPMFAGAVLVVTNFDSAHGEFNISFQGLSQTAKNLLDIGANQAALKSALEQKGYVLHIITTTTQIENVIPTESSAKTNTQRDGREDQQQGGQQKKKK